MTLDRAIEAFKAEFPGWWFKVGECRMSCDADIGLDKHDLGPSGISSGRGPGRIQIL